MADALARAAAPRVEFGPALEGRLELAFDLLRAHRVFAQAVRPATVMLTSSDDRSTVVSAALRVASTVRCDGCAAQPEKSVPS